MNPTAAARRSFVSSRGMRHAWAAPTMDAARRTSLQLQLLETMYRAEIQHGDAEAFGGFVQRAIALLDRIEPELPAYGQLRDEYGRVRGLIQGRES